MTSLKDTLSPIDILLSTYNGGLYIKELLQSLFAQTYKEWRLIVRDDGSTDNTLDIVETYASKHHDRIVLLKDGKGRLGPCQSFAALLEYSPAPYIMFCDQDDVWLPNKIELTLKTTRELEAKHKNTPILVHTDLKVVDERLNPLAESFWKYQHINPARIALNNLLIQNVATGCAMMLNMPLKKAALPIPSEAMLHDWWITLVAASSGRIEYINSPTMLYRQHGKNDTGAIEYSLGYFIKRISSLNKTKFLIEKIVLQSKAFLNIYKDRLPKELIPTVYNFSILFERGRLSRLYLIMKFRYFGYGFMRNLGILVIWTVIKNIKSPTNITGSHG